MRTDEELAQGMQRGYTADLATLVDRHHHALIGFLFRMGGDRRLAEDLAQETFVRLLRSIRQYQYPRPFKPWLYAIASNLARDHFKSADARYTDALDEAFEIATEADTWALSGDEIAQVHGALQRLPTQQREALVLRYYNDLSLQEIADALHIPVGTVKSRLSLGLRRMKQMLEVDDAGR